MLGVLSTVHTRASVCVYVYMNVCMMYVCMYPPRMPVSCDSVSQPDIVVTNAAHGMLCKKKRKKKEKKNNWRKCRRRFSSHPHGGKFLQFLFTLALTILAFALSLLLLTFELSCRPVCARARVLAFPTGTCTHRHYVAPSPTYIYI